MIGMLHLAGTQNRRNHQLNRTLVSMLPITHRQINRGITLKLPLILMKKKCTIDRIENEVQFYVQHSLNLLLVKKLLDIFFSPYTNLRADELPNRLNWTWGMNNGIFELHELGKPVEGVEIPDTPKYIESYRLLLHEINNGNIRLGFGINFSQINF